ncbi:OmpA family protein [Flavobacteriaceae bacterium Ap0902]|nr:OmpA family protein [Flavobacteriaceae bacterium Ap0902]
MKQLKLFTLLGLFSCITAVNAQEEETIVVVTDDVEAVEEVSYDENLYYGMNQNYVDFTTDQKKFNDWSLAVYGGLSLVQGSDLNTWVDGMDNLYSYDIQGVLTKQISHAFGLGAQFNWGRTEQQATNYRGYTDYWMWSLIGDINFSNLLRRVDNKSRYAWALHGYGGIGTLQYEAYRRDTRTNEGFRKISDVGGFGSVYINGGAGLRYKINQDLDIEAKGMYYFTGDEEFDGSGPSGTVADLEEGKDDGLFTFSLGLVWKIGKHHEHLAWADPLADIYPIPEQKLTVCAQGDNDDDGVCDDWDRELDTPLGARVDGAGRALDTDLDGVIDLHDKCVTVPGPADNDGCPLESEAEQMLNLAISNLEFSLDSDVISPSYYPLLDQAANYLKHFSNHNFDLVGHTDARASQAYNLDLSRRRAEAVKSYLVEKHGIPSSQLNVVAMGKDELRFPECVPATKCPEWKNHANRRVVFVQK